MVEFGKTTGTTALGAKAGASVQAITLASGDLQVVVLTYGAILQSVRLRGVAHDLTLGSDTLADYETAMIYHGAIVAPVVNRLSKARAVIDGRLHQFESNIPNGHSLHSASAGTHLKLWQILDHGPDFVELAVTLPDGEGGFPGNRHVTARFTVSAPATLRLDLQASTDAPTVFNAANHSYWTMNGAPDWTGHRLQIAADRYLPVDDIALVTGQIAAVDAAMDFRHPRAITPANPPLDHNFCLSDHRVALRDVAWLHSPDGALSMTLATTEPGLQIYDGRAARRPGHGLYEGLAFEAQGWPDAPNNPAFPQIALLPGTPTHQVTEWRFARHAQPA